jgi:hypothetical protein
MRNAEEKAWVIKNSADPKSPPFADQQGTYEWWVQTFGASETEFEEMKSSLATRFRRTPWWRKSERRAIILDYIKVYAILNAGSGLETVWR